MNPEGRTPIIRKHETLKLKVKGEELGQAVFLATIFSIFSLASFIFHKSRTIIEVWFKNGLIVEPRELAFLPIYLYYHDLVAASAILLAFTIYFIIVKDSISHSKKLAFPTALAGLFWVYGSLNQIFYRHFGANYEVHVGTFSELNNEIMAYIIEEAASFGFLSSILIGIAGLTILAYLCNRWETRVFSGKKSGLILLSAALLASSPMAADIKPPVQEWSVFMMDDNYIETFAQSVFEKLKPGREFGDSIFQAEQDTANWIHPSDKYPFLKVYAGPKEKPEPMNVLLIIAESLRNDLVSLNNPALETTPFIDRLSQKSFVFNRMYIPSPMSCNSVVAALCSIYPYPYENFITKNERSMTARCLPEILHSNNYTTAVFHAGTFGNHKIRQWLKQTQVLDHLFLKHNMPEEERSRYHSGKWGVEDMAMAPYIRNWINKTEKPFFLMYFTVIAHKPYDMIPKQFYQNLTSNEMFNGYLASLKYTDHFVENIYEILKETGKADETIIVIAGDHGEPIDVRPGNHGYYVDERETRVFSLIHHPKYDFGGITVNKTASIIDLAPTILDLLNINDWNHNQGESLFIKDSDRKIMLSAVYRKTLGLVDDEMKFIYPVRRKTCQIYNLSADPYEKNNLKDDYPGLCREYEAAVLNWSQAQHNLLEKRMLMPQNKSELMTLINLTSG